MRNGPASSRTSANGDAPLADDVVLNQAATVERCPHCGDNGIIDGWAGTRWDRTPTLLPEDDRLPT